jgi:prepilin-type N-terminal cleavage/methylation domain-containing protein
VLQSRLVQWRQGFSLVEIIFVLALFGLIISIVFIAVPQVSRVRRDNERKYDLGRLADNLQKVRDSFVRGHQYPQNSTDFRNLLGPGGSYTIADVIDPAGGGNYSFSDSTPPAEPTDTGPVGRSDPARIYYQLGYVCGVSSATENKGLYRLYITLESGGLFCIDNH